MPQDKPTNLRAMQKRHERQLVWMAAGLLVIGGGLLIGFIFSWGRALAALPFLFLGAVGIVGLYALVGLLTRWVED